MAQALTTCAAVLLAVGLSVGLRSANSAELLPSQEKAGQPSVKEYQEWLEELHQRFKEAAPPPGCPESGQMIPLVFRPRCDDPVLWKLPPADR